MALPVLTLGAFDLTDWSGSNFGVSVIAEGTSKGAPVPIEVAVKSWLQDGSVVVTQGYDNRTVTLRVRLRGPDLVSVADAEAALHVELGKPNLLTWTTGDGLSPAAVFVVVTSSMEHAPSTDEDLAEGLAFPWRTYNLRLLCKAHVRSETETITAALPASGSTTTTLDACSAATGWTGTNDGTATTVSASGGAVSITAAAAVADVTQRMLKTFSASTASTPLLMVDWRVTVSGGTAPWTVTEAGSLSATGDGVALDLVAEVPSATSGYTRSYFRVAASSLAAVVVQRVTGLRTNPNAGTGPDIKLSVDNVAVTNVNPTFGTGRQQARILPVGGSARSDASLAVEASTALGDTQIYVYPSDATTTAYSPSLRQYRTAGPGPAADSSLISGQKESLGSGGITFTVPMSQFPRGTYLLMARTAMSSGSGTTAFVVTAQTVIGSNNVGPVTTSSGTINFTTAWVSQVLMRLTLPTVDVPAGTTASLQLNIQMGNPSVSLQLDEAWLYNTSIGNLTCVPCGTGTAASGGPAKRLFMEPASVESPRPTLRIGHAADRSDSFYPTSVTAWQPPTLDPPQAYVHVVTSNATDAAVSSRGYAQWHSNPAS